MIKAIDESLLQEVLADETNVDPRIKYPVPEQRGPLRRFEREMRCASRGCGSSTYFKLQGIPYCMIHCLRLMNEMLVEYTH